jgi:transcriptional regulator with XRE-family HTH domain
VLVAFRGMGRIVIEGLRQGEIAGLLGVHRHAIWRWERGPRGVPGWAAVRLAEIERELAERKYWREVTNVPEFRRRHGGGKPRKSN